MPNEEYEDQNPAQVPGLGELTRAKLEERGEAGAFDLEGRYAPPGGAGADGSFPMDSPVADLARGTRIIREITEEDISKIAPGLRWDVTSTFDARPIQARDFVNRAAVAFTITAAEEPTFTVETTFTVAENYVGILRRFRFWFDPIVTGLAFAPDTAPGWIRADLFVNDTPVANYTDMRMTASNQEPVPCFILADELQTIKLKVINGETLDDTTGIGDIDITCFFELYGNELQKSGIPKEFQIANRRYR